MQAEERQELENFVSSWGDSPAKKAFLYLKEVLEGLPGIELAFKARPGITYSLRGKHPHQEEPLFVMVDVIDDDPANRWLSVCFYDQFISDPKELGNFVPGGLLGKDARCFDLEGFEEDLLAYVAERIKEAFERAGA